MSVKKAPGLDAQIGALATAFFELSKMLGKENPSLVTQLARALETKARAVGTTEETRAALDELARRLRNP